MLNIILALVVLMFLITVHELGHYTAGKMLKFRINEFAIGMGPKIYSKTNKNGEVFSIRALPLGGFCAFDGEDAEADDAKSFNSHKPWKRIIVLFAGVLFNFVIAVLIAIISLSCYGLTSAQVGVVYGYSPSANQSLLQEGDIIYSIDGDIVYFAGSISSYFDDDKDSYDMVVIRDGNYVELSGLTKGTFVLSTVTAVSGDFYGVYTSGDSTGQAYKLVGGDTIYSIDGVYLDTQGQVSSILTSAGNGNVDIVVITADGYYATLSDVSASSLLSVLTVTESSYSGLGIGLGYTMVQYSLGDAILMSVPYCIEIAWLVLSTLAGLFTGSVGLDAVGGPITTISITSQIVASGFANVLTLIVMLSVNLAVFNLLPIPALDGCRIIFVLIEWIRGKAVDRKIEGIVHATGLILLVAFMIILELVRYL